MRSGVAGICLAACLSLASGGAGAADAVQRLTGEINYASYPAVAALLSASVDKTIAFDVTLPIDNTETDGHLTTFVLDGQFEVAYLAGRASSKLYADVGFDLVDDKYYTLDGVFTVRDGGAENGAATLLLEFAEPVLGTTYEDVPIAPLKAAN